MTREAALAGLEGIAYASAAALQEDKQYFIKKMGWTPAQLDEYIARPERPHSDYPSERPLWNWIFSTGENRPVYRFMKQIYRALNGKRS
jgi:hypothetical protein